MTFSYLLGQAGQSPFGNPLILMVLMMVMIYFIMIRPQNKARKDLEKRVATLKKGDKVITAGGIHAPVHHVSEKTVTLKLSEGVFVPFEKTSIQTIVAAAKTPAKDVKEAEVEVVEDDKK